MNRAEKTAKLNDVFRKTGIGGKTVMTVGIANLDGESKLAVYQAVQSFNKFTEGNDPYGEHDFGIFELSGRKIYWKIDYYDNEYKYGSDNPSDPSKTKRVLTIMLAEEY